MAGKKDIVEQALKLVTGGGEEAAEAALRQSAQKSSDIPAHLLPGFKIEAAQGADEETRNLVNYLGQRDPNLAFDPQSLAERRQDLGMNVDAFHGSPRNIESFKNVYSNPQGYWGGHHYATSSPLDASVNYATPEGADLLQRLQGHVDEILDQYHPNDVIEWHEQKYGTANINPQDPKLVKEYADDYAKQMLGITNEGAVYPVALRMQNPVKIDSPNQTFWDYNAEYDDDGELISEGGKAIDLIQATQDVLSEYDVDKRGYDEIIGKLYEAINDYGGIDAKTYDDIMRKSDVYAYDASGELASMGHIMSDVFQRLGHDSIDMPTDVFAGGLGRVGMRGTGGDTRHYIVFEPKNIRSRFGAFDPFKAKSERISDADGGRVEKSDGGGFLSRAVKQLLGPSERKGLSPLTKPGSGYKGPVGKPSSVKLPFVGEAEAKPIPQIMDAATDYLKKRGVIGSHELEAYPTLDEAFAMRVAEAYDRMKHAPDDPAVRRAYDAMAQETIDQLKAAENAGIEFTAIRGKDPYAASPSLGYADIAERGNLYFFPTDAGFGSSIDFDPSQNPLLKRIGRVGDLDNATVNDAFRIVHDLYGHYGPGNPFFRAPGEERAYLLHRRMYSPEALPAMTSETRGQNSWLNFGPYGPRNRTAASEDTVFADQKTGVMDPFTYLERADGGAVDDDVNDALRIAKQVGGVLMEDAKGNKYDAQGNLIPPTTPGPNPARTPTPQEVGQKASMDPATFDALMQQYAVPDRDIAQYEATKAAVAAQPREIQQMTHVGDRPTRAVKVDMPLFGGEYSVGSAPYDVAGNMSGVAQTAYDLKTVPFYAIPLTAPIAAGMDVAEGVATNDPLTASLAVGFGPGGKYAKAAGVGAVNYFMDPAEAEAGPARWFSKAMEAAQAIPMEKMTGQQALAMLRKGVSPEELKWTGVDVFLPQQKQITKQELVDYLAKNRVQTNDIMLGGTDKPTRIQDILPAQIPEAIRAKYRDANNAAMKDQAYYHVQMDNIIKPDGNIPLDRYSEYMSLKEKAKEAGRRIDEIGRQMRQDYIDSIGGLGRSTKYENWATQGGEKYRELLIRAGKNEKPRVVKNKDGYYHLLDKDGQAIRNTSGSPIYYMDENDAQRAANSIYRESGKYKSSHWDDPDVVAHVRAQMLDVTPPGANRPYKAYNVDETQSDWAQDARKRGIYDPSTGAEWQKMYHANVAATNAAKSDFDNAVIDATQHLGPEPTNTRSPEFQEYHSNRYDVLNSNDAVVSARRRLNDLIAEGQRLSEARPNYSGVQSAPYIGSTQGWTDLSIKKSLDQALDSGADYFTFTPGEVHADRYDLSKHIGKVQYNPDDGSLMAYGPDGKMVINESIGDPKELDQYVGKELGDKLRNEEAARRGSLYDSMSVDRTEEGDWGVFLEGEQMYDYGGTPISFESMGEANDYINEQLANEFANNPVEISGLDLKVGGEGMIDYYNNIYKKRVEKVVKDATGKKVQWEVIPVQTADGPREQLGFRITDMQDARFSDFNKGGRVTDRAKYADSDTVSRALALTSEV